MVSDHWDGPLTPGITMSEGGRRAWEMGDRPTWVFCVPRCCMTCMKLVRDVRGLISMASPADELNATKPSGTAVVCVSKGGRGALSAKHSPIIREATRRGRVRASPPSRFLRPLPDRGAQLMSEFCVALSAPRTATVIAAMTIILRNEKQFRYQAC